MEPPALPLSLSTQQESASLDVRTLQSQASVASEEPSRAYPNLRPPTKPSSDKTASMEAAPGGPQRPTG